MFRKSSEQTMPDIFSNIYEQLDAGRQKQLNDKRAWHNLFYQYITSKVDESPFAKLYERTDFDLVVMKSLGLNNVNDEVPCIATYYNFRRMLYEHQVKTGEDLTGEVFQQLSKTQAKLFGVNGKFARMDSKLYRSGLSLQGFLSV